jgi:thioredoxin 2
MRTTFGGATAVVACPHCGAKNRVPAAAAGAPRCGNCQSPLPWIVDTTDRDFATVADEATIPVLVDVWAPWCGPCRMVTPVLEQLARERAGELKLVKINADEAPEVSRRFQVKAIPTLILLHHGRVIDTQIGAAPAGVLRSWLTDHLPEADARHTRMPDPPTKEDQR